MLNFYGLEIMHEVRYKSVLFASQVRSSFTHRFRLGEYTARAYPEHTSRVRYAARRAYVLLLPFMFVTLMGAIPLAVSCLKTSHGDEPEFTAYNKTLIPSQIPFSTMIRGTLNLHSLFISNFCFPFRPYTPSLRLRPCSVSKKYFHRVCPNSTVLSTEQVHGQYPT
jgi:hypothetical protein